MLNDKLKNLVNAQGIDGNWNYDSYTLGMYNGMELMLSIVEGRSPEFKECEDEDFLYHKIDMINPRYIFDNYKEVVLK